jgi:hypothetical protein
MSKTWGQDSARHLVHEHQKLNDLMEELNETDMSSPGWLRKFQKLHQDYKHHMKEENEVFGRAKEVILDSEIEGYGQRFAERKQEERGLIDEKREDSLKDQRTGWRHRDRPQESRLPSCKRSATALPY